MNAVAIEVVTEDPRWANSEDLEARIVAACQAVVAELPCDPTLFGSVSVLLANDDLVSQLNATFRDRPTPTNVLSFPTELEEGLLVPGEARPLGDIALAYETVASEAERERKSLQDHAAHLAVHGLLHILGHDHQNEEAAEAMEAFEVSALARVGIANPYGATPGKTDAQPQDAPRDGKV